MNFTTDGSFGNPVFIISLAIIALELLFYFPAMIYGTYSFGKYRHNILIGKRYPSLTLIAVIGILTHSISWTFATLSENKILLPYTYYAKVLRFIGTSFFIWPIMLRFWMLFYNINWIYQTQNQNWKSIIDPSFKHPTKYYAQTKQWFIVNHKKYGNYRLLKKYLPMIIIGWAIILITSYCIAYVLFIFLTLFFFFVLFCFDSCL